MAFFAQPGLAAIRGRIARLRLDRRGMAAVEFAMVVPIMITAYFGCVEATQGFSASRKVAILARSLSDLTAQAPAAVAAADLNNVFDASKGVMAPFDATAAKMTITGVVFSSVNGNVIAYTDWSVSRNGPTRACGQLTQVANGVSPSLTTIPQGLANAGTTVVVSDVTYVYTPLLGGAFKTIGSGSTMSLNLTQTSYMRPRAQNRISYAGDLGGNQCNPTYP